MATTVSCLTAPGGNRPGCSPARRWHAVVEPRRLLCKPNFGVDGKSWPITAQAIRDWIVCTNKLDKEWFFMKQKGEWFGFIFLNERFYKLKVRKRRQKDHNRLWSDSWILGKYFRFCSQLAEQIPWGKRTFTASRGREWGWWSKMTPLRTVLILQDIISSSPRFPIFHQKRVPQFVPVHAGLMPWQKDSTANCI